MEDIQDLADVPAEVNKKIELTLVENVDEVLAAALAKKPPRPTAAKPARAIPFRRIHRRFVCARPSLRGGRR
jgi:hypothetical protein